MKIRPCFKKQQIVKTKNIKNKSLLSKMTWVNMKDVKVGGDSFKFLQ